MTWILMYCFWKEIAYSFNFLKRLKHIILGADYMKYNLPVNRAGLRTTTNCSLILHETFTSLKRWWAFQDTFEIKWKQPATEISSEFFFFQKIVEKVLQQHVLFISSELLLHTYFKRFQLHILWSSFQNKFQEKLFWHKHQ